jgi:hypothetical protein
VDVQDEEEEDLSKVDVREEEERRWPKQGRCARERVLVFVNLSISWKGFWSI